MTHLSDTLLSEEDELELLELKGRTTTEGNQPTRSARSGLTSLPDPQHAQRRARRRPTPD